MVLPQRFQTSRPGLLVSWREQLATDGGELRDGLESGGGEGSGREGGAIEGGLMEVKVQRKRTAAVWARLEVSEADLEQEGVDGGLVLL